MVKKVIVAVDYVVDKGKNHPTIYIFYRTENGRKIIKKVEDFEPYFFINKDEPITSFKHIKRVEHTPLRSWDGKELKKIITYLPTDVRKVRGQFTTTYEADVLFATRYIIDATKEEDWEEGKLRVLYLDIEVDDEAQFPSSTSPTNPIPIISCYDNYTKKYYIFLHKNSPPSTTIEELKVDYESKEEMSNYVKLKNCKIIDEEVGLNSTANIFIFENEKDMLSSFFEFVRDMDFDLLVGWNVMVFDMMYLLSRAKYLGVDYTIFSPIRKVWWDEEFGEVKIGGRGILDLLQTYKRIAKGELKSYSLDYIAKHELGLEKMKVGRVKGSMLGRIARMWRYDLHSLLLYNVRDVYLCLELDKKVGLISFVDELRKIVRADWNDFLFSSKLVDILILRKARELGVALPTKQHHQKDYYEGAIVLQPKSGVHRMVFVSDFKSLYPSIIQTFNISPDTLEKGSNTITLPNQISFTHPKEKVGLIPQLFKSLFELRKKYKEERNKYPPTSLLYKLYDNKQFATKTIINSIYGVMGHPTFRLFNPICASTVTFMGRWLLSRAREFFENERGLEVVYGDTDSVFFKLPVKDEMEAVEMGIEETERFNEVIMKVIRERFGLEDDYVKIHLEPQKLFSSIIFTSAKKRYAGYVRWEEGKWLSSPQFHATGFEIKRSDVADITIKIQKEMFKLLLKGGGRREVEKYLREEFEKIKRGEYPISYIAIPKTIRKRFEAYKANIPWVRGVLYSNKYLGMNFQPGDKVKLLFVKATGKYPPTDVIAFYDGWELPPDFKVDWVRMIEHNLINKINNIFTSIGWRMDASFLLSKQKTLWE